MVPGPLRWSRSIRHELVEDPVAGFAGRTGRGDFVDVPPDFAFREARDVDPQDHQQVFSLMREWGLLCPTGRAMLRSLPRAEADHLAPLVRELEDQASVAGVAEHVRDISVPIAVAARHLQLLQVSAMFVEGHLAGDDDAMLGCWSELGFAFDPHSVPQAWTFWQVYNTAALTVPFAPHVFLDDPDFPNTGSVPPDPTTYEVAMLQLSETVTQHNGALLRCANERCQRVFLQQRGRRKYAGSHHKTGVLYCSYLCARAQSQRERRARRKAEVAGR